MSLFESKEAKERRLAEERNEIKRLEEEAEQKKLAEIEKKEEERKKEWLDFVDKKIKDGKIVIALHTSDTEHKALAMEHLLKNGYVCVENYPSATKYTVHCILLL